MEGEENPRLGANNTKVLLVLPFIGTGRNGGADKDRKGRATLSLVLRYPDEPPSPPCQEGSRLHSPQDKREISARNIN